MAESAPVYVLDSFAVMAHFQAESGSEKVLELLEKAGSGEISQAMSLLNVGGSGLSRQPRTRTTTGIVDHNPPSAVYRLSSHENL